MFYEATCGLNRFGICAANLMPFSQKESPQERPSPRALADAHPQPAVARALDSTVERTSRPLNDEELTAIRHTIANHHPVACGMRWPKSMKGNQILAVPGKEHVFDGHSIALVGYDDDPRKPGSASFAFATATVNDPGDGGYGLISYAYVRAYANDALWLHEGPPQSEMPIERFEAEGVPIIAREAAETSVQSMADWETAMWSGGKQLFVAARKERLRRAAVGVQRPGRYRVRVLATAGPDYGTIHVRLDGKPVGPSFDLYSGRVCPSGTLELGTHELTAGEHQIRFTSVGKDRVSADFHFGLDAIDCATRKPASAASTQVTRLFKASFSHRGRLQRNCAAGPRHLDGTSFRCDRGSPSSLTDCRKLTSRILLTNTIRMYTYLDDSSSRHKLFGVDEERDAKLRTGPEGTGRTHGFSAVST